jgi:hypothetical protein
MLTHSRWFTTGIVFGIVLHCIELSAARQSKTAAKVQRQKIEVKIALPRYNLHDALAELVKQTGIEAIADAYAKPRPKVDDANRTGKPFRLQAPTIEKALDQLCAVFGYEWTKEGNVYLLRNKYPQLDEPYQVSDAVRQKVDAAPNDATFKHLAQFLDLKQEWMESLAEQHPPFILLSEKSPRRDEIAFYARLPEPLRAKLDKGGKVAYNELPKDVREQVLTTAQARWKSLTPAQVSKFVYRLTRDSKGWQRLQTLNLPNPRPSPQKAR